MCSGGIFSILIFILGTITLGQGTCRLWMVLKEKDHLKSGWTLQNLDTCFRMTCLQPINILTMAWLAPELPRLWPGPCALLPSSTTSLSKLLPEATLQILEPLAWSKPWIHPFINCYSFVFSNELVGECQNFLPQGWEKGLKNEHLRKDSELLKLQCINKAAQKHV